MGRVDNVETAVDALLARVAGLVGVLGTYVQIGF